MFDQSPSLQEFVDPLPICQPETDLGNMLSIFQHSNCKLLAIPQGKLGWGIVSAEGLLSVVTEAWLGDRLTLTSHPRNLAYQQNLSSRLIPNIKNLIKPVIVYQGEMKLNEFLDHLQCGYLTKDSETCLIVNQQGELQGQLARDKVIKYLALQSSAIPQLPLGLNDLGSLLEGIRDPFCDQLNVNVNANNNASSSYLDPTQQILATATHELKSPLTGILGLSSLLQEQQLGSLNQRQARYLELIYHSGKKMMNVVDDLIQLAALNADPPKHLESINLKSLCRQLYQEVLLRVNASKDELDSRINLTQLKINVDPGKEIAIANKRLLSTLLFQLMLAAVSDSKKTEHLEIEIKSASALTAIVMTSQTIASSNNLSFNLMIAKYLSTILEAEVTHTCSKTSCQFTLLLQPENLQLATKDQEEVHLQTSIASSSIPANLTILCLYPELEVIDPQVSHQHHANFDLKGWSDDYGKQMGYQHRIIEADSLEQAHNLARIWQLDAIILNGYQIAQPNLYLRSLQESEHLASLPLITLDTKTTEAANQIEGLNVYPCLLSAQQCNLENLIQVIQIAIES